MASFLNKAACFLLDHTGSWKYERLGSCRQEQICTRCDELSYRVVHNWPIWRYTVEHLCDQERSCERCGLTEVQIEHKWGVWQYESPVVCQQVRLCSRCSEKELGEVVHKWSELHYESASSCHKIRQCAHCGIIEQTDSLEHQWGDWQYEKPDDCRLIKKCQRCNEIDARLFPDRFEHVWTKQSINPQTMVETVQCQRCRKQSNRQLITRFSDGKKQQEFQVFPLETRFEDGLSGVYIAVGVDGDYINGLVYTPLYVAETSDISTINADHPKWNCLVYNNVGAICIHTKSGELSHNERSSIASRLINSYDPYCNRWT